METGNITKPRKAPAPTVATLATASTVNTHFDNNQPNSVRRASSALDMKWSSLHRILQTNKWQSYKMQIIQKLSENDKRVNKNFADTEMEISRILTNENYLSFLTFSDKAHFHLPGVP